MGKKITETVTHCPACHAAIKLTITDDRPSKRHKACLQCGQASGRGNYCSAKCRQKAYRERKALF